MTSLELKCMIKEAVDLVALEVEDLYAEYSPHNDDGVEWLDCWRSFVEDVLGNCNFSYFRRRNCRGL